MRRAAATLIVSTATAAALALAPAAASAQWLAPASLGQLGSYSFEPAVTAAPDGSATAIWPAPSDGRISFVHATRPAGGAWGQPTSFESIASGSASVDVVSGPDGTTTATWIASVGASQAVRTATRPPGGAWSAPVSLSDDTRGADRVDLAVGPDGTVAAIWRRNDSGSWTVQARVRPAGGAWGAVSDLAITNQDLGPRIAVDGQGGAHAIWTRFDGVRTVVQTATKPAAGGWSAAQSLSDPATGVSNVRIAVSPSGDAVAAWTRNTVPSSVQVATKPAGGAWSARHDLSAAGRRGDEPHVGIDAAGNATAVWSESDGAHQIARAAVKPAGGAWGASTPLSLPGQSAVALTFAATPDGAAAVGWVRNDADNTYRFQAVRRAPGGAWSQPEWLTAAGRNAMYPKLALDGRGNAVGVWDRAIDADANRHEIQAAGFDGEAPVLSDVSVPAAAVAGTPFAVSAAAFDVWSPVQLSWSLGDGATATGPAATHAFAAAGDRQVTITATDATGRAASATRTVTVAPVPAPPGGGGDRGGEPPAPLRVTVAAVRQRLGAIARQKALRATCSLTAVGRCTVATIPARAARALGLKVGRKARTYALGSTTVRIARPGARATAAIALDRRERRALARARTLKVTYKAAAGAARATGTTTLRR